MIRMPVMVALKVFEYYPKGLTLIPIHDDELNRWSCAIYKTTVSADGSKNYHETLFELGHYNHTTKQSAVAEMVRVIEETKKNFIIPMSN